MEPRKQAICEALARWINQRPGFDPGNYDRADSRKVQQQRRDALTLLGAVESWDPITWEDIVKASENAFSGRLTLRQDESCKKEGCHFGEIPAFQERPTRECPNKAAHPFRVNYCTGQYWCTEYRAAAAAVLASALWEWTRAHAMPAPTTHHMGNPNKSGCPVRIEERYAGKSAGDWLRAHFRREFGRGLASRWFS